MSLYFITGNKNKFKEIKAMLPDIKQLNIDLLEIQEIDARKIIKAKLQEALKNKQGEFIVEDTSLYLECLNGLPGPLIKWFLKTMGIKGLAELVKNAGNKKAEAKTIIGYANGQGDTRFFEGVVQGKITAPKGKTNFGWDPIFMPRGHAKSFAEMSRAEKNKISMRRQAVEKLRKFLEKK